MPAILEELQAGLMARESGGALQRVLQCGGKSCGWFVGLKGSYT